MGGRHSRARAQSGQPSAMGLRLRRPERRDAQPRREGQAFRSEVGGQGRPAWTAIPQPPQPPRPTQPTQPQQPSQPTQPPQPPRPTQPPQPSQPSQPTARRSPGAYRGTSGPQHHARERQSPSAESLGRPSPRADTTAADPN